MYFYIYKTTNLLNNKFYIGCHTSESLINDYLGSGKILKFAIKKYGRHNFKKEIIKVCSSKKDMFENERNLVNESTLKDKNIYNIRPGGRGGFTKEELKNARYLAGIKTRDEKKGVFSLESELKRKEFFKKISILSKEERKKILKIGDYWSGRKHREESKRKIGLKNSFLLKGVKNPMYGKIWIYNTILKKSLPIKKEYLSKYLFDGWLKGRKIIFI